MNELEQLDQWRLDEQRRIDQRREDDRRLADLCAADERARIQLRHSDAMRLADMRASSDPALREIGAKVQQVMDSMDRQRDRERAPAHAQEEPDRDPGWFARWEQEGTMTTLTPAERDQLHEMERAAREPTKSEPKAASTAHEPDEDEEMEM